MSKLPWTPWHKVLQIRDDLKSGELSLAVFAADLYDVMMGKARPVYQKPHEFFALTYHLSNFQLARACQGRHRAAGGQEQQSGPSARTHLTYGGGKTHALITLFHLASD